MKDNTLPLSTTFCTSSCFCFWATPAMIRDSFWQCSETICDAWESDPGWPLYYSYVLVIYYICVIGQLFFYPVSLRDYFNAALYVLQPHSILSALSSNLQGWSNNNTVGRVLGPPPSLVPLLAPQMVPWAQPGISPEHSWLEKSSQCPGR